MSKIHKLAALALALCLSAGLCGCQRYLPVGDMSGDTSVVLPGADSGQDDEPDNEPEVEPPQDEPDPDLDGDDPAVDAPQGGEGEDDSPDDAPQGGEGEDDSGRRKGMFPNFHPSAMTMNRTTMTAGLPRAAICPNSLPKNSRKTPFLPRSSPMATTKTMTTKE